jgi:hypothetical protein
VHVGNGTVECRIGQDKGNVTLLEVIGEPVPVACRLERDTERPVDLAEVLIQVLRDIVQSLEMLTLALGVNEGKQRKILVEIQTDLEIVG